MNRTIQIVTAIAVGVIEFFFGEIDRLLYALLAMIIIDYATGVIAAIVEKRLSSAIGFKGIAKKICILLIVATGHIIGCCVLGKGETCRDMIVGFFIMNEGISVLENGIKIGLPVPQKFKEMLEQVKNKAEGE